MSVVIPFAPRRKAALPARSPIQAGRTGEILFFTGVRYERQTEMAPEPSRTRRRREAPAEPRRKRARQPA